MSDRAMTEIQVREAIRTAISCAASLRTLAKSWGVSPSHLSDCANGRRAPGELILRHFGLERRVVVSYVPSEAASTMPGVSIAREATTR